MKLNKINFETVRICFLGEVFGFFLSEILLPLQRDKKTSPIYCDFENLLA